MVEDLHKITPECLLDTRCAHFLLLLLLLHALPASEIFRGVMFEYDFSREIMYLGYSPECIFI